MKKGINKGLIYIITEIIQFIIAVMFSITILWLYTPYTPIIKFILTLIGTVITYDILKNFVWIKYILWKEENK
jgi:hypothetical protein